MHILKSCGRGKEAKTVFYKLLLITVFLSATAAMLHAGELPNVILLMGDDHAWDEVGFNGHPHLVTPVLDEMAATGLVLDRFYSASPVCSPTRGSVLTGRHPNRYGTFTPNWSIRPEEISIAQVMKKAGYRTGHFGKWHVGPVKKSSPTSPGGMGFDEWLSHDNFFELDPVLVRNGGDPEKYPGESSQVIIDETIRFIGDANKRKMRFLAVVWFGSPHEPYIGLPEDIALYEDLPMEYADKTVTLTSVTTGQQVEQSLRDVLKERYSEITAMDRAIGHLRKYLKQAGLSDNTILWYCGDNGIPSSGDVTNPFRGIKGSIYEGGTRVPCIIEWPAKISKPRVSKMHSVTSDIFPTLAGLINEPLPDRPLDGISIEPLLQGELMQRSSPIFFWNYDTDAETAIDREPYLNPDLQAGTTPLIKMLDGKYTRSFRNLKHSLIRESDLGGPRAVLDGRYKLVINADGDVKTELFDIIKDPYETEDIAGKLPEVANHMMQQLLDWQQSVLASLTGQDY